MGGCGNWQYCPFRMGPGHPAAQFLEISSFPLVQMIDIGENRRYTLVQVVEQILELLCGWPSAAIGCTGRF